MLCMALSGGHLIFPDSVNKCDVVEIKRNLDNWDEKIDAKALTKRDVTTAFSEQSTAVRKSGTNRWVLSRLSGQVIGRIQIPGGEKSFTPNRQRAELHLKVL